MDIPKDLFDKLLKGREDLDEELNAFVDSLNLPRLDVFYEDILQDEADLMDRLKLSECLPHPDPRHQLQEHQRRSA